MLLMLNWPAPTMGSPDHCINLHLSNMSDRKTKKKNPPQQRKQRKRKPPAKRAAPKKFNSVRMGQRIGGLFGKQGGRIGAEAGRLFRQVTGVGDYKVEKNTLLTSMDRLPAFRNMSSGTRIQHREFLFDVITSADIGQFKIQQVPIQPAILTGFPWLSASAENYQEYQLNGVIYEFKSNSYDALASTNTASGTVVMATNYNVLDPAFTNKFQMEQTQFTCSAKPSVNLMHPIECAKIETPSSVLYTRSGPTSSGDLRLYDWANFHIATVGMQGASVNIGELWVTYDVTLLKPKLSSAVDIYDHWLLPASHMAASGPAYFGQTTNPPVITEDSDMGTTLSASPGGGGVGLDTITWPAGYTGKVALVYRAYLNSTASATLADPYTFTALGGVTGLPAFGGSSTGFESNEGFTMVYNANGGTTLVVFLSITNGGSLSLNGGTSSGPLFSGDLFLIALPSNFLTSDHIVIRPTLAPTKTPGSELDFEGDMVMYDQKQKTHSVISKSTPQTPVVQSTVGPKPLSHSAEISTFSRLTRLVAK